MRLKAYCVLGVAALAGVWATWPPIGGFAQDRPIEAGLRATYRVDLAALNLGEFHVNADFSGSRYEMRAKGRFSLMRGMLYEATGKTMSKGEWSRGGPQPAKFTVSYDNGKKKEQRELRFTDGAVSDITILPKKRQNAKRRVPVTKDQLEHVLDPLTAAFLSAHATGAPGDLRICDQTVPVFDGKQRFDLVLKPKRSDIVGNDAPPALAGTVAVCQVRYVPISGYKRDQPGVKFVSENQNIEVWLAKLPQTSLYIPYRVVMPTAWGTGSVTLTDLAMGRQGEFSQRDD
jgi:hypothetical protein